MNFTRKFLLVDDEAHVRKYLGLILKQLGATNIVEAANGEEAVAVYERERPSVVLMDVNMPKVDGLEALRKLKEIDPDCTVVMLTSLASRGVIEQALSLGAANYLRKDTPKEEIAKALTEVVASLDTDAEKP